LKSINFIFQSKIDKKAIYSLKHLPEGKADAAVIISHGMGEYKERYEYFSTFLCSRNLAVYIIDHRGHGETASADNSFGILPANDGWLTAASDLLGLYNVLKNDHPDIPVFLLGHSYGSFLAVTFAIKWGPLLSGVLLSGTAYPSSFTLKSGKAAVKAAANTFGTERSLFTINALCFAGYALSVKKPKTEFDWICSDQSVVREFMSNPRSQFLYSNGFYLNLIEGLNYNYKPENLRLIPPELPFYFFSGAEDPVGDQTRGVIKAAELLQEAGVTDITMKFYDGMRHEILNEKIKDSVYNDLYLWLNKRI